VERVCPLCGKTYTSHPAISRVDNATPICPECGIRQALESIGMDKAEIEEMIKKIPQKEDK
jgi:transposase